MDVDTILRQVQCYKNINRVRIDIIQCTQQIKTLLPKVEQLFHPNGTESLLVVLSGTVPINYQGKSYNIPVDVYVSEVEMEMKWKGHE